MLRHSMSDIAKYSDKIKQLKLIKNSFSDSKSSQFERKEFAASLLKELLTKEYKVTDEFQHELTRKHISEKFQDFSSQIATKDDIIKYKKEVISNIKKESLATQEKLKAEIEELKCALSSFLPHKRAFKISLYFVTLFLFFMFSELFFNIQIIDKFWGSVGLSVSGGFLVMSYFLFLDWKGK